MIKSYFNLFIYKLFTDYNVKSTVTHYTYCTLKFFTHCNLSTIFKLETSLLSLIMYLMIRISLSHSHRYYHTLIGIRYDYHTTNTITSKIYLDIYTLHFRVHSPLLFIKSRINMHTILSKYIIYDHARYWCLMKSLPYYVNLCKCVYLI